MRSSQVSCEFSPSCRLYSILYVNASTSVVELQLLRGGILVYNVILAPASDARIQLPFHLPLAIDNMADLQLTTQWSDDIIASVGVTLNLVKDGVPCQQYSKLWSPLALFQQDCRNQSTNELVARLLYEPQQSYREVIQEIVDARLKERK